MKSHVLPLSLAVCALISCSPRPAIKEIPGEETSTVISLRDEIRHIRPAEGEVLSFSSDSKNPGPIISVRLSKTLEKPKDSSSPIIEVTDASGKKVNGKTLVAGVFIFFYPAESLKPDKNYTVRLQNIGYANGQKITGFFSWNFYIGSK